MNRELNAMNKISRAVESTTADLSETEKARVLDWFSGWLAAQHAPRRPSETAPDASDA